ncbi:MAG TPA: HAD-IC family P-type ATPase [Lapillicoccus sp.]|nr:HAD-IC family P-type ATPase [Lapillicoccus sp.]
MAVATDPDTGLTSAQVAERVTSGQVNTTEQATSRPLWTIIKSNVFTRFNAILGVLFVLVLTTGSVADGLFGVVLVVNSGIGIVQEYLAKRKLDQLALLNQPTIRVVRDRQLVEVPTTEVVLGELVELRAGDQVPADGHLHSVTGLEVDEANLTGESDPIPKQIDDEVWSGTTVVAGRGRFVAAAVGAESYVNSLAAQAKVFTQTHSEIQASVNTLLKYITWVIVLALPLQIWSQIQVYGADDWRTVIVRSTGGLVGLVPEGLVLLTSVAFLLAAVTLSRQQVLVQELPAVEGLARVDVVCLDKTGTLTVGDIAYDACEPVGEEPRPVTELETALGAMADDPNANGTMRAIAVALSAPTDWTRTHTIAFNSDRKWSAASFADRGSYVLGAPDVLLLADDPLREQALVKAKTGLRVVMLGHSEAALDGHQELPPDLRSLALVSLTEQVRPDAKDTLDYFASQGVHVKIISGDNPQTVGAIARRVGLDLPDGRLCDARTVDTDVEGLRAVVQETTVFGRVSPEQKRALVHALQRDGHVVAMTGDGVNDALAIKDADIGVAMNNGAQATKAVAQLVLLDGKFSHLPSVLAEGRRVINNVERVANLFVAKNVMSLIAIVTAAAFALPFPFLPRHLTLVSAVTIGIPAFFLALGPNRRRYHPGFLRRILRFAVPAGAVCGVVVIVSYLLAHVVFETPTAGQCAGASQGTVPQAAAQTCWHPSTAATISLLVAAFWILVVLARPFRPWKAALVAGCALIAVGAFTIPIAQQFFQFAAPAPMVIQSLAVGAVGAVAIEVIYRLQPEMRQEPEEEPAAAGSLPVSS